MFVYVCVRVRERENRQKQTRESEREREREQQKTTTNVRLFSYGGLIHLCAQNIPAAEDMHDCSFTSIFWMYCAVYLSTRTFNSFFSFWKVHACKCRPACISCADRPLHNMDIYIYIIAHPPTHTHTHTHMHTVFGLPDNASSPLARQV